METLIGNRANYIQELLWIRNKSGELVPFHFNYIQWMVMQAIHQAEQDRRKGRFAILKYRRGGITTLIQALEFHQVATYTNRDCVTLAHDGPNTEKIFRISELFYQEMLADFQPHRLTQHNKKELDFNLLRSIFWIGTAGSRGFGRGSTLQIAHWCEVAWSPGGIDDKRKLMAGLTEAADNGLVFAETTPNGIGDYFYELWSGAVAGTNGWTPLFFPWFIDPNNCLPCTREQAIEIRDTITPEEKDGVFRWGWSAGQIRWRRDKIMELGNLFPQEYPEEPTTCFLTSGLSWFNKRVICDRLLECPKPVEVRDLADGEDSRLGGNIVIWEKPQEGVKYAAGGDVAEGLPDSNFSTLCIVNVKTLKQVARLRGRWKPEVYANLCAKLATEYHRAILAIERNNHGHSALNTLINTIQYTNLYYYADPELGGKTVNRPGWKTDAKTRPIMLDDLRSVVESGGMEVNDYEFLKECLTFIKNSKGKYCASEGNKDDLVIGWAIAMQARNDPNAIPRKAPKIVIDRSRAMGQKVFNPSPRIF